MAALELSGMALGAVKEKVLCQVAGFFLLTTPLIYMYILYPVATGTHFEPSQRGFFCDDEYLRRPYVEHVWVPNSLCLVIWTIVFLATVIPIEILVAEEDKKKSVSLPIQSSPIPWLAVDLYRIVGSAALGNLVCLLVTEISKYSVGRLRPHFLTICDPFETVNTTSLCQDNHQYKKFVEIQNSDCFLYSNETYSEKQLRNARLAFMSGHASFSFFNAIFLVVYTHIRLRDFHSNDKNNRILLSIKRVRPFIQFGFLILAFWISLTRVSDYFHHPGDVIMGAVTGIIGATLTFFFTGVFSHKSVLLPKQIKEQRTEEPEYKTQKTDVSLI